MSKHKPTPIETLDSDFVDSFIASQGNKATTVVYFKVSGDMGKNNGLPKVQSRRVWNEKGKQQAARMADSGQRFFDFPKPKVSSSGRAIPGFSFFNTRVAEIRAGKKVIRAKGYNPDMLVKSLADQKAKKLK